MNNTQITVNIEFMGSDAHGRPPMEKGKYYNVVNGNHFDFLWTSIVGVRKIIKSIATWK